MSISINEGVGQAPVGLGSSFMQPPLCNPVFGGLVGPLADVSRQRFRFLAESGVETDTKRRRKAPPLPLHKFPLNWKFIVKIRGTQPLSAVQCIVCAALLPHSHTGCSVALLEHTAALWTLSVKLFYSVCVNVSLANINYMFWYRIQILHSRLFIKNNLITQQLYNIHV